MKNSVKHFIATFCFIFLFAVNASAVVPSAPLLTATTSGLTVSLSWSAVPGATGYILYYAPYPAATPIGNANMGTQTSFSVTLTGGAAYYVALKAYNNSGSSGYSNISNFTIQSSTSSSTVTDIEGNVYNTVVIGTQTWMGENLKVTKYRSGGSIPTTTGDISSETSPQYQWPYNDDESNVATYGRLYTWETTSDSLGLCPSGWHVPTDDEWTILSDYLITSVGGKLKETGTSHWNIPNSGAINKSGFTALPGGLRDTNGTFYYMGADGRFWSSSESSATDAWSRGLSYGTANIYSWDDTKSFGYSIRCVKD